MSQPSITSLEETLLVEVAILETYRHEARELAAGGPRGKAWQVALANFHSQAARVGALNYLIKKAREAE